MEMNTYVRFKLLLQAAEEVDDLCLDRNVQSGYRLVADDDLRLHGEGAGNVHTLSLAAGELGDSAPCAGCRDRPLEDTLTLSGALSCGVTDVVDLHRFFNRVGSCFLGSREGIPDPERSSGCPWAASRS